MPEALPQLASLLDRSAPPAGSAADPTPPVRLRVEAALRVSGAARGKGIAVIPIIGPLVHRPGFAAMSYQEIAALLEAALADASIGAIVLDVDSPGGMAYGAEELAAKIFAARNKPIIAVANPRMASGAYYIGSQASVVVASPSAEVGSIGVIAMHINAKKFYERMGLEITEVTAGKFKGEFSDARVLSDDARAWLQSETDRYYDMFVAAVARGRGVTARHVQEQMGQGRVLGAGQAKAAGMVDRIQTLEETIQQLAQPRRKTATALHPGAVGAWAAAQKLRA